MSPSHVIEPTYRAIKDRLMAGAWPPGARLEATRMADDLGVSMSPVRDSLNRLAGERMVDLVPGDGFRVTNLSEQRLRDLWTFSSELVQLALGNLAIPMLASDDPEPRANSGERAARLFERTAQLTGNREFVETMRSLNQRLARVRCLDQEVLGDADFEIEMLELCWGRRDIAGLRERIVTYHQRRLKKVTTYICLLDGLDAGKVSKLRS